MTDWCGNVVTGVQFIFVNTTPVSILECVPPPNVTVACNGTTDPAVIGAANVTGACPTGTVQTTFTDNRINGSCVGNFAIERLWVVTDGCGATANASQFITVEDTVPPTLVLPPNVTIACEDSRDPAATGNATATDNCDNAPVVTFSDSAANQTDGDGGVSCANGGDVIRTWTATGMLG